MKIFLKLVKYILFGLFGLFIITIIGLFFYYQSIYKETPFAADISVKSELNNHLQASVNPVLLPIPKKLEWKSGHFNLPQTIGFTAPTEDIEAIKKFCLNRINRVGNVKSSVDFRFIKNKVLGVQAYHLSIEPKQIKIEYSDIQGLFYALTTIKQLAHQSNCQLPCVQIEDQPDLRIRGAMLDISRGKIPTLETLYGMVDFLSDLKYNQLQLYIEGFSFSYPSFKNLLDKTATPLTPEEIKQLDIYCKDRFIELVPNQNSLGHMQDWLKKDEYKELAECPEGYKLFGLLEVKTTMSPSNPKTLELVKKMSDDLLPNFTSSQFNVNLDEPFELGKSNAYPINDPKEVAKIYINYAKQLNDFVNSEGKTMMMWGDLVSRNPEIIPEIPKNITLLEWRYESLQPFDEICAQYQKSGLHYMVCPGTSSWSSFTGRTDNMMGNVENAVNSAVKFGADGLLMTDWGDTPHLQYLTVSYAGLAYAGALSWNNDPKTKEVLSNYLSKAIFNDSTNRMGNLVLEMGRYNQFEEYPMMAMTTTSMSFMLGIMDKTMLDAINRKMQRGIIELLPQDDEFKTTLSSMFNNPRIYNAKAILNFADDLEQQLLQVHLNMPDSTLIVDEYKNALRMVRLGAKLKQFNNYHLQQTDAENKTLLSDMKLLCQTIVAEHKMLWMSRNKSGGFDTSIGLLKKLETQVDENLALLDKNPASRWVSRSLEKIKSAAGVLYLR